MIYLLHQKVFLVAMFYWRIKNRLTLSREGLHMCSIREITWTRSYT